MFHQIQPKFILKKPYFYRLPPEPKEEKAEGKPVSQLRFRIPATHTRESDETATDAASANVTNGETKSGEWFLAKRSFLSEMSIQSLNFWLCNFDH